VHPRGAAGSRKARLAGNAVFLLLALAMAGVLGSVAYITTSTSAVSMAGAADQSPLPPSVSGDPWIPLHSQAPGDIIAAARQSPLFQESRAGSGDHAHDLSRLGRPVFVRALRPTGESAAEVADFYVVPILNQAGAATDAAELALNPSHTAVQVIAIVTYTVPRADGSATVLRPDQAIHAIASQLQEAAQAISQPYLVYFPLDPAWQASQNSRPAWTAGGTVPADPLWLVTGTDGKQYLVGNDGRLYSVSQLPFWHGQ
jgi:hypothetical protein